MHPEFEAKTPPDPKIYPPDGYNPPDWLRYARTACFDGYSPPLYPRLADFDPELIVRKSKEIGADTLRFQPVGYWAYYPSRVFPVDPNLGERDLIDEVSRLCRKENLHIYCYTGYAHPFLAEGYLDEHPQFLDWVCRDPEGKASEFITHYGSARRHKICRFGHTYRESIRKVVGELCAHDIDGVYFDGPQIIWMYAPVCFCQECRQYFRTKTGMDLERLYPARFGGPLEEDLEAHQAWIGLIQRVQEEDLLDFRRTIHNRGKFMMFHNGSTWDGKALPYQYRIPDGFMVEYSPQIYQRLTRGMLGAALARPTRKLAQAYTGSYNTGEPPYLEPWAVHNTNLEDGDEILMEGFANLASGSLPMYCMVNRLCLNAGSGSAQPIRQVFEVMQRAEPLLKDSLPAAAVSVVASFDSMQAWRTRRRDWNMAMNEGFVLAMLDEHIPVDVMPNTELTPSWLSEQRVLALCGVSGMSQAQAEMIAGWVKDGGRLLATADTGLFDEWGQPRTDGGALREVLGVAFHGEGQGARPDVYLRVSQAHAALGDLAPESLVQGDNRVMPVEIAGKSSQVLAEVWDLGNRQALAPGIVLNAYGAGQCLYVNASLEAYYPAGRVKSQRELLGALVRYLYGDRRMPFEIEAPAGVYGVLRQSPSGDLGLWLLAPVGFKDAAVGRMRQEFLPVEGVKVRLQIPHGRTISGVTAYYRPAELEYTLRQDWVEFELPRLQIGELVHIRLV